MAGSLTLTGTVVHMLSSLFSAVPNVRPVTNPLQPPLSAEHNDWTDDTMGQTGGMTPQACTPPRILLYIFTVDFTELQPCKHPLWILW